MEPVAAVTAVVVAVVTAAGTISIGMIPIDEAHAVRDVIVHGVETDRRPWM